MLISFRFKNFRSFFYETSVDMKAMNYKEFSSHLITTENNNLIKTLAVLSADSSRENNLLLAFASYHSFVYWQLFSLKSISNNYFMSLLKLSNMDNIIPFQEAEYNQQPTIMELNFISEQQIYEYGFTIYNKRIIEEHLIVNDHVVYIRDTKKCSVGLEYEKIMYRNTEFYIQDNRLFCSVLSNMDIPEITAIMEPFENFFNEQVTYYFDFLEPFQFLGNMVIEERIRKIMENPDALNYGLEQLRKIGIPVEDCIFEYGLPMQRYNIKFQPTEVNEKNYMEIRKMSNDTIKHLSLFIEIYNLSLKGGILITDSNEFQPAALKIMVDFFRQESNKNMQLIFITKNNSIINDQKFRKDEVAFIDVNESGKSRLYHLTDIKVCFDSGYSLDNLLNKYGDIALIKEYIL